MLNAYDHFAMNKLGMLDYRGEIEDRFYTDVSAGEGDKPFIEGACGNHLLDLGDERTLMETVPELVRYQILAYKNPAKVRPELFFQGMHRQIAIVLGLVDVDRGRAPIRPTLATLNGDTVTQVLGHVHREARKGSVQHCHVYELAPSGPLARQKRDKDCDRRHEPAGGDVRDLHSGDRWRSSGRPGEPQNSRNGYVVDVVSWPVPLGATLT